MRLVDHLPGKAALAGALLALAVTAPAQAGAPKSSLPDVVDTAVAAGSFKTLATALQAAGLVETLKGPGPFTVFAPTDEAFAKLPAGTAGGAAQGQAAPDRGPDLPRRRRPGDGRRRREAVGCEDGPGQQPQPSDADKGVTVDGAKVVKADIQASNGVIHVIDAVLIPRQ